MVWSAIQRRFRKPVVQASLGVIGTLLLITILGLLVLRPTLVTISQLVSDIKEENRLIGLLNARISSLQTVEQLLAELEPQLPLLAAAIPSQSELEIFIKEVELLAQKNQLLKLEIFQPGFTLSESSAQSVGPEAEVVLPLTIIAGGSEAAIRQLIADLNQIDRLVVFRWINLTAVPISQRDREPYPVTGTIRLDIIYLQEAANR